MTQEIRCLICNNYLKEIYPEPELTDDVLESKMWHNATVSKITVGFGSKYDTHRLVLGLCDHCIGEKIKSSQIIDRGTYLDEPEFKQQQEENLKKMTEDGTLEKLEETQAELKYKREVIEGIIGLLEKYKRYGDID